MHAFIPSTPLLLHPLKHATTPLRPYKPQISRIRKPAIHSLLSSATPSKPLSTILGDTLYRLSTPLTNLFPLWTILASLVALSTPTSFNFPPQTLTYALSGLMLSTGLTLTLSDLRFAIRRPLPILLAFLACYILMPALALLLTTLLPTTAFHPGLILLGIISGGQASNLCTLIAGGDVALSVAMTTTTTLCAVFMLPLLSQYLLGTMIPVNASALALSTAQIVLLPILAGAFANKVAPQSVARIKPILPVFGICMLLILILGPVAQSAQVLSGSLWQLAVPVGLLHIVGGAMGYVLARLFWSERVAVTTGFETGFKSPALAYVLACKHFESAAVAIPSAVSIVVLAPLAAVFAVLLRGRKANGAAGGLWRRRGKREEEVVNEGGRKEWNGRYRVELGNGVSRVVGYDQLAAELARARRGGLRVRSVTRDGV